MQLDANYAFGKDPRHALPKLFDQAFHVGRQLPTRPWWYKYRPGLGGILKTGDVKEIIGDRFAGGAVFEDTFDGGGFPGTRFSDGKYVESSGIDF